MEKRVEIILRHRVAGFAQKREIDKLSSGKELVAKLAAASEDNDVTVGEDLIGGVPSADGEIVHLLGPVTGGSPQREGARGE